MSKFQSLTKSIIFKEFYHLQISNNVEIIHNVNPDISWSNFGSILTVRKNPKIYNFEDLFSLQFASADQLSTSSNGRPLKTSIPTKSQKNNFSKHIFVIQRSHSQLVSNERRDKNTSISGLFWGKWKRTNTLILKKWCKNHDRIWHFWL